MKTRTQFQEFIFRVIKSILQDDNYLQNWDKTEYKKFIGENLRRYSEFTSQHKNIVNNISRLKENCKFTVEAINELEQINSSNWKVIKEVIHQEHILPIAEAIRQLISIEDKQDDNAIWQILDKLEIIVISKQQRKLLDGAGGVGLRSSGEPSERLNAINAILHEEYKLNHIR